jgi:glycosyltransferase involved in cell wall biosynthesis
LYQRELGRPIKVAYPFVTMPVGGAEDLFLSLARYLSSDIESVFVCLRALGVLGEEALAEGRRIELVPVFPTKRITPLGIWRLARWFRENGIQIVHAQTYHDQLFGVLAAKLAGIPSVVHQHKTLEMLKGRKGFLMKRIFRLADHVVTLSEKTRADLIAQLGLNPARVTSFPNAVDSAVFHPSLDRFEDRSALGLDPDCFLVGSAAQLHPTKNHEATVEASASLGSDVSSLRVMIFGEGESRVVLERLIAKKNAGERITLAGRKRPIAPWLRSLDLFVLPSYWEGQPMALLQALECGIPILASRIEGNVALLGEDHPGLFDPNDREEYATLLAKSVSDLSFRELLLTYQGGLHRPSLSALAEELAALYRRLVSAC